MDIGSALIMVGLLVVVAGFLARPLAEGRASAIPAEELRRSVLQAERDKILSMIREIEMDHAMGKIGAEDFQAQRASLVTRGSSVLREIDALGGAGPQGQAPVDDLDAAIEAAVASRRSPGYCTRCGQGLAPGDRFCARCGTPAPGEKQA